MAASLAAVQTVCLAVAGWVCIVGEQRKMCMLVEILGWLHRWQRCKLCGLAVAGWVCIVGEQSKMCMLVEILGWLHRWQRCQNVHVSQMIEVA